jgi:hypothetical protein
MGNIDHFAAGAIHNPEITILGTTAPIYGQHQTKRLYNAEHAWQRQNPVAGQTIGIQAARDLVGEIVNHPSSDNFDGIEDVRANYRRYHVQQLPGIRRLTGMRALSNAAGHIIFDQKSPLTVGTVTHEATHLILPHHIEHEGQEIPGVGHGWGMARSHAYIAAKVLGNNVGKDLAEHYKTYGVDYGVN